MPVFRQGTRNQGTSGQVGTMSSKEVEERRRERRERNREWRNSQRITTNTPPVPGRVTNPPGAIVSAPGGLSDGILGGQFGNNPGLPGAYDVPLPPGYQVPNLNNYKRPTPQITPVNNDITAIGGYKYSTRPGTGGMPGFQQPSLIGAPGSGNYYANSDNWTTIQSAEEAQSKYGTDTTAGAYRLNGDYGVRGDKWKVKTVKLPNGQWVKLTVPDYNRGARKRRNRASRVGVQRAYQTPQAYEQSVFNQVMSWRAATG